MAFVALTQIVKLSTIVQYVPVNYNTQEIHLVDVIKVLLHFCTTSELIELIVWVFYFDVIIFFISYST